jgi:hypothetical protein
MDTRGAIGVTERQQYFARMRDVAREVSDLYLAQRHRLEYPFLDNELWQHAEMPAEAEHLAWRGRQAAVP